MAHTILIIKLGLSETLVKEISDTVSLGDVLRTTALLHLFKNDHVTWLTAEEAIPLLAGNKYIKKILAFNLINITQLKNEHFDVIINLEKVPGICALADSIVAWRRYGFRFDAQKGTAEAYERAYEALSISLSPQLKRKLNRNWLEVLYEMLDEKWKGEGYILGYKPKTKVKYDVGFNIKVGKKWTTKAWSEKNWEKLEELLKDKYSISYQQFLNDINGYIDWINSCRLLVTNDSLGLHIALALKKKIVALFGPTSGNETYLFKRGIKLFPPKKLKCLPCFRSSCKYKKKCIDYIKPETVAKKINQSLRTK